MSPDPAAVDASDQRAQNARAAILNRENKLGERLVHVPQWESEHLPVIERDLADGGVERGNVLLIELDAKTRADMLQQALHGDRIILSTIYADIAIGTAHHPESRARLFSAADRDALNGDSGAALERVATPAAELCGITDKSAKEAEGNSSATPDADSTST